MSGRPTEPRLDLMPSAAERWMVCSASPRFCLENADLIPPDTSTRFSKEGNSAHEVAAAFLQNREPNPENCPVPIDEDMRWHGWNYAEYVQGLRKLGSCLIVEQKMPLWYYEGRHAIVDAAVLNPDHFHIVDYKYGEGIIVTPEQNLQVIIYARQIISGCVKPQPFTGGDDFPITLHIFQPRGRNAADSPFHFWQTTWGEIKRISDDIAANAYIIQSNNRVKGPMPEFVASEKTCQWCPAKGFCPERRKQITSELSEFAVIEEPATLPSVRGITVEQLAAVLKHKDQIISWLNDAEEYAMERMKAGHAIPGFKLVTGRSGNRYWIDPVKAVQLLTATTVLKREELIEEKVKTPAQVEKLIGKKKFNGELGKLIGKPPGNAVIAPEDDEREPYFLKAEDEFSPVNELDEY